MPAMNQSDKDQSNAEPKPDTGEVTEAPVEDAQGDDTANPPKPGDTRSRNSVAWLAFLIALLAAAGTGYQWNEQRSGGGLIAQMTEFSADMNTANVALKRLTSNGQRVDDELQRLSTQFNDQLNDLPARVEHVERSLETLPGLASNARSTWLLAEVEYLLRVANVQLNLTGNIDVSLKALDFADEKLRDLGDPRLIRVRSKLNDERAALRAVPSPDAEGIIITLGTLSRSIDELPFGNHAPDRYGDREKTDTTESGWQRAWRVIVNALMSIITVKRDEESVTPLMSDASESMLIRSLDLELQTAKFAILRNEANLYRDSLQAVADRLKNYFDIDSPAVKAAQDAVGNLLEAELPQTLPDISGSLALLLQIQQTDTP
jgi:uroporphyrin-3 C-methyltransferase